MKGLVKRVISGLLSTAMLAVCATSLTSCETDDTPKTTNSSFNYETDMQYMYYSGTYAPMTKSDTGYYYVGGHNMIIYVDKESQKATPLCSKPNCLHTDDKACDAYFSLATTVDLSLGTYSVPIQYYKGNLYMVTIEWSSDGIAHCYLVKTDKAGKNREKITDELDFTTINWMIHRGYFYYATDYAVKRISLNKPKSEPEEIITIDADKTYEGNQNAFSNLIAYGDYVYVDVTETDVENNSLGQDFIYSVNTSTLKSTKLEEKGETLVIDAFFDDSLILYTYDSRTSEKPVYYKSNLDGSDRHIITGENFDKLHNYSDGEYFYQDNQNEAYKKNIDQVITVYDKDSNKIDSFKLKEGKGIKWFFAQDEDYFIFTAKDENGENQLVMADKSQIGNINGGVIEYKTLCKLKWFEVTNLPYIVVEEDDKESDIKEQNSIEEITFGKIKEDTKKLGYNVSDDYDTFNNKNVVDGFSVKLSWKGDGGTYSGDFQILNFTDVDSAEKFKKENPLVISNKENIAYISIKEIPTEIYQMLLSIISGNPVAPIEVDDFSGDSYKIN